MLFLRRGGVCSVPTQGRAFLPRHFCITHTKSPRASCCSFFGQCSFIWSCPLPRMDTWSSGWLACAYGLLLVVVASRHPPARCVLQMAMTKDAFGGSRVIHGQKWPIRDEISQKLDLYPDRLKSGVLCRPRPHIWGSPTPKFLKYFSLEVFPRLHTSRYKHSVVRTRPVRSEECIRLDSGWPQ